MSQPAGSFKLRVEQIDGFEFRVRFDKDTYPSLVMDEPAPLGRDVAPNPARILAAAIGDCLAASLLFCAKRSGAPLARVSAEVEVELVRNEQKRLRVGKVGVTLSPETLPGGEAALSKCLDVFEDFCVVTQSVRQGIDVEVHVNAPVPTP